MSIVPRVDPSSAVAITSYLEQAKTWLSTAVEQTGPEQIARAKAEIATAAEAAKQLNLSREIQDDAKEMVRRAEYALGKSIRKGQSEGTIASPAGGRQATGTTKKTLVAALLPHGGEQAAVYDMADLDPHEFDQVIAEAKAEGNVSRVNVARKAREVSGKPRKSPRRPLNETARHAGLELNSAIERIERVLSDDRFGSEADQVAPLLRNHLSNAIETCQGLLDRVNNN